MAACVTTWSPPEPQPYHRIAPVAGAEPVGADECVVCHEDVSGHAPIPIYHADCETCHGPGDLHADSEEIADIRFPGSGDCLGCHESGHSTHLAWSTSEHERYGVTCSDCHESHNREPKHLRRGQKAQQIYLTHAAPVTNLCVSCHADVAARLDLPSHHPVREGMMECTDCHDPHADRRLTLGPPTAQCASCHQDVAGPWIFEHAPVAEDCGYCHDPHGTVSDHLLTTSQPGACLGCHTLADSAHIAQTGEGLGLGGTISPAAGQIFFRRCTDCHGAIHGSYQDPHLRR
jgi:DmsE family decaheme c-type cytochrome